MSRLSVSIWPSPEIVLTLSDRARPVIEGVRWSTRAQWMVKVRPLGSVRDDIVPQLVEVLRSELDGAPPVRCELGPRTRRIGGQWLGAPVSGLDDLAVAVFAATEGLVPVTHPQAFQADLVLARGQVPSDLAGEPITGSWIARSLALVADRSAGGSFRFEDLATFPLTGP